MVSVRHSVSSFCKTEQTRLVAFVTLTQNKIGQTEDYGQRSASWQTGLIFAPRFVSSVVSSVVSPSACLCVVFVSLSDNVLPDDTLQCYINTTTEAEDKSTSNSLVTVDDSVESVDSTVHSLNSDRMVRWIRSSVSMSTAAVASSSTRTRVLCSSVRARHSS